ncbi:MAG: hypothetical protein GXO62_04220 [Epsilonproteobacteria bacterium]|nr:hypothetical protein [Campylobacterota bacterium]
MRYLILLISILFAFENKTYNCETIGIEYKESNQTLSIPNTQKTSTQLKQLLKDLYSIKASFNNKDLTLIIASKPEKLTYVNNLQKKIRLYKNDGVWIVADDNSSQIAINIPSQNIVIYYQCR